MKINEFLTEAAKQRLDAKCWKGYKKQGTKMKGDTRVNNCVPESAENADVSIEENFADGKNPQDKGDAKRHGVPTKASVGTLRKVAKQGGRKGQLAHWMANMKAGRAKNEGEGDPEGLPHLTREMLGNIVQQVETEGAHAIVKSLEWGDGAAEDLLDLIVSDLKKHLASNDTSLDEQFDIIEDMVEELAEQHGVDSEAIWEDFESVNDNELFEAAWQKKSGKNKNGGLNAKGVASYRRENPGSKLQTAVTTKPSKLKPGSKAAKRRKSFCARMGGVKGPMKKDGKPTRKALALRKWNC